jgi:hypothetical protein
MTISLPFVSKIKILTGKIPDFNNIKKHLVDSIDSSSDVQKHKTNLKCKMTDWHMHEHNLYFKKIAEHVKCHVETYQRKAYRTAHNITVTECWGAHYTKTDRAIKHSHYPALWSGVAYVQSPNKSSPTVFPECKYSHAPKEGTYIIFPGWLKHYVENGSADRYVCAFNMRALNTKDARRKKNSAN